MLEMPGINWIKNTPEYQKATFSDGSVFLVALQLGPEGGPYKWDFDVVQVSCDGEWMVLNTRECSCSYSAWSWDDFEYFALLDGEMPKPAQSREDSKDA